MQRRGGDWRVAIDGVLYAVQRVGVSAQVAEVLTSNTEGVPGNRLGAAAVLGCVTRIPDLPDGTFSLTSATFDDEDNPFASPINLILGGYYVVQGWPAGLGGVSYLWANCMLQAFDHSGSIPGPQPVNLVFKPDACPFLTLGDFG